VIIVLQIIGVCFVTLYLGSMILLHLEGQKLGIFNIFDKKRQAIIDNTINLIKEYSEDWKGVDSHWKHLDKFDIKVRCTYFEGDSKISNQSCELDLSLFECMRLSKHFEKINKYRKNQEKTKKAKEQLDATDSILLTTSKMDRL